MSAFFDARNVEPSKPFEALPPGWYPCVIHEVEYKATRGASAGKGINFDFRITAGEYAGSHLFQFVNVENKSEKCQDIGQKELSAICHATAVFVLDTPEQIAQFKGRPIMVRATYDKPSKKDIEAAGGDETKVEKRNKVSGVKAMEGASVAAPGLPTAPGLAIPAVAASIPAVVAPPVAAPVVAYVFPPADWLAHPQAPGHFYRGQEVKTEAELKAMYPAPAPAPVAASIPAVQIAPPPPVLPAAPVIPAVLAVDPLATAQAAGWQAHPQAPGHFYLGQEVLAEADLRARYTVAAAPALPAAPAVPAVPLAPAIPAVPTVPAAPAAGGDIPPWDR